MPRGPETNFFEDELDPEAMGIEMDYVEMCALEEARDKNQSDFYRVKRELADESNIIGSALGSEETPSILYPPGDRSRILCYQLATLELKRLEHPDARTYCSHTLEDHKKALRAIIAKLPEQAPSKAN